MSGLYVDRLPGVLAADEGFVRFVRIFEDVGTPLYDAADGFAAQFDPALAPPELARWLGGWLGLAVDETLPPDRRRQVIASAAANFGTRGSRHALEGLLEAVTGGTVSVDDPGGIHREGDGVTGGAGPDGARTVEIALATLGGVPRDRIEVLVRAELPAWLPYRIVVGGKRVHRLEGSEEIDGGAP